MKESTERYPCLVTLLVESLQLIDPLDVLQHQAEAGKGVYRNTTGPFMKSSAAMPLGPVWTLTLTW
jgi:hypothetical protein